VHKLRFCIWMAPFNIQWNCSTSEIPQPSMIRAWGCVFCSTLSAFQHCRFRFRRSRFKICLFKVVKALCVGFEV
jgi:hypothetical protein